SYETLRFCGEIFSGGYRETVFSHQAAKVAKKVGASISWRPWRLGGLAAWCGLARLGERYLFSLLIETTKPAG
ncbi:MAG TPA: hypothetical protein VGB35_12110, partial [Gammaproteobacteria bacterium]